MKKMFLLILIATMYVGLNYANANNVVKDENGSEVTYSAQEKRPRFKFNVMWGRWKNGDCVPGFGICEISISIVFDGNSRNSTSNKGEDDRMTGEIENTGRELLLIFNESDVRKDDMVSKNILNNNKGGVKFEQGFTIPSDLMREMGYRGEKFVPAGTYKTSQENGKVMIHIPL